MNQRRQKKEEPSGESVQEGPESESYETNRDTMIHIQIIFRLVEGCQVDLDRINDLIQKMRQHSIDFRGELNYSCSQAP